MPTPRTRWGRWEIDPRDRAGPRPGHVGRTRKMGDLGGPAPTGSFVAALDANALRGARIGVVRWLRRRRRGDARRPGRWTPWSADRGARRDRRRRDDPQSRRATWRRAAARPVAEGRVNVAFTRGAADGAGARSDRPSSSSRRSAPGAARRAAGAAGDGCARRRRRSTRRATGSARCSSTRWSGNSSMPVVSHQPRTAQHARGRAGRYGQAGECQEARFRPARVP